MKFNTFKNISLLSLYITFILISLSSQIRLRQFPQYHWNPNLADIKKEYETQKTVEYFTNQGLTKSQVDYNHDDFVVLPNDTQFQNQTNISKNDSKPYYPNHLNISQPEPIVLHEKRQPTYRKDPKPYYSPLKLEVPYTEGVAVKVEYGDLWMNDPTKENLDRLKNELLKLTSRKDSSVYYDTTSKDIENQIKFYKEKINAMEYRLDNVNKTEREELNEFYLGSNMKNVSIVNKLNSTVNYYAGENRTISEAEGVREILGEKYIQKENKSQ